MLQFFIIRSQKKKNLSALEENWWKIWKKKHWGRVGRIGQLTQRAIQAQCALLLSGQSQAQSRVSLSAQLGLSARKPTKKPKASLACRCMLNAKSLTFVLPKDFCISYLNAVCYFCLCKEIWGKRIHKLGPLCEKPKIG